MLVKPLYSAAVCSECQHACLVADGEQEGNFCRLCGADNLAIPGAKFVRADVPIFEQLERVVRDARLSKNEATLIAGELEAVGLRWEPPELVLQQLSLRLDGLRALYDPKQEYSRLLLTAGMLLTIVCARMIDRTPRSSRSTRSSGIRCLAFDDHMAERDGAFLGKRG